MGTVEDALRSFETKRVAELTSLRAKLEIAESALAAIDAFIQHWQEDKRAGLKPTDISLATGRARSRAALAAIREGRK